MMGIKQDYKLTLNAWKDAYDSKDYKLAEKHAKELDRLQGLMENGVGSQW